MRMTLTPACRLFATAILLALSTTAAQAADSFKDLPSSHKSYAAAEFLKASGVLQGYDDGTFRPNNKVSRAEAVKILVSTAMTSDKLPTGKPPFGDIPDGAWYAPYVSAGLQLGVIDGPPKATAFNGANSVRKAEFLKMLLLVSKTDPLSYGDVKSAMSSDVTDSNAWYYPYMRYALASSMLNITPQGTLGPGDELTRADVAQLLYFLIMYKNGRRTQALLSVEETDLINVSQSLANQDIAQAEFAATRALLAAKGAYTSKPTVPVVQGALKSAEGFSAIVRGYRAGQEGNLDEAIRLSKEAWSIAAEAKAKSPELGPLSEQLQQIASNMASEARKAQGQPAK